MRFVYDGSFDLSILREDEWVESAGDGTGACYVRQPLPGGRERRYRIDVGQTVNRDPHNGLLYGYAPAEKGDSQ